MPLTTRSRDLGRMEAAFDDAGAMLDAALAVREDEAKLSVRAGEAMLAQHGDQHRRHRHGTLARFRLRPPDLAVSISTLVHVQLAALEIDIDPAQAAQFARRAGR